MFLRFHLPPNSHLLKSFSAESIRGLQLLPVDWKLQGWGWVGPAGHYAGPLGWHGPDWQPAPFYLFTGTVITVKGYSY